MISDPQDAALRTMVLTPAEHDMWNVLVRVPGIGDKLARRIILDLRGELYRARFRRALAEPGTPWVPMDMEQGRKDLAEWRATHPEAL